jgi:hypothetical protein
MRGLGDRFHRPPIALTEDNTTESAILYVMLCFYVRIQPQCVRMSL